MKDSGVEWLGMVPEHWDVQALQAIARVKSIPDQTDRELLSVYLDLGVIRFSDIKEKRTNVTSEDLSKYQAVDPGDFVLNNQQAWRGSVGVSKYRGVVSPAYLVLSLSSRLKSEFANLLFRDRAMVSQYVIASKGVGSIQRNLYWHYLKRALTLIPPLHEQVAIARYLDYVGVRVRRLTEAKRKLIGLLTEYKQAIIHRAVTRGLDPNVPLKDSDIEWLGMVPQHWEIERGKNLFAKMERPVRESDEVITCFRDGTVTLRKNRRTEGFTESLKEIGYQGIRSGDLVIHAMDAFAGSVGVADSDGKGTPVYAVCKPKTNNVSTEYQAYVIREMARSGWILSLATGIRERSTDFRFSTYANQRIPLPPVSEQIAIVEYLNLSTTEIDISIARAKRQIELLNEYRTRLVADVVTGKLDVRDAILPTEDTDTSISLASADSAHHSDLDSPNYHGT